MATKEKWIDLFEKVVGRKPTPAEFVKAKEVDFDLKQIKAIAGLDSDQQVAAENVAENGAGTVAEAVQAAQPVQPVAEVVPVAPAQPVQEVEQVLVEQPVFTTYQTKPQSKKKKILFGLGAVALLALGAGYYYMDSVTGMDIAVDEFQTAVDSNDYDQIATLLSSNDDKWSKSEAKDFIQYLNSEGVDIKSELDAIEASGGKNTFNDQRGNKLLGLREKGRKLGLFPEYQVTSYPVEILVNSDLSELSIDDQKIEANKETSLGEHHFANKQFKAKGKTKSGDFETSLQPNLSQAEENRIVMTLSPVQKTLNLHLPVDNGSIKDIKVFSGDKEIAKSLSDSVEVLDNQHLDLKVSFNFEGATFTTESTKVLVDPAVGEIYADLTMSSEESKKLTDAQKAKESKEAQAKEEQETKEKIQTFMNDYIESMRSSITHRTVQFDRYFDTSSEVYRIYVNYIEGGGVARANIDYQTTIDYTVTDVKKDGDNYVVTVHNQFREVYLNGKSSTLTKKQVFNLRQNGDSFLIYGVSET